MQSLRSLLWAVPLLIAVGLPAHAAPAIQIDLASRTDWTFRPDEAGAVAKPLATPAGGWRLNGFPTTSSGTYERTVRIPKLSGGGTQNTLLTFEAVNWEAVISAGPDAAHLHEAGRHLSAWTPFIVDISPYVTPGLTALIRVQVRDRNSFKDDEGRFTTPSAATWNDWQARGILRGVALQVYPPVYVADLFVKPDTTADTLTFEARIVNGSDRQRTARLSGTFSPWNLGVTWPYPAIAPRSVTLAPRQTRVVTFGPLPWKPGRASWWWPNVPYRIGYHAWLHNLVLTLNDLSTPQAGRQTPQQTAARFGFCTPGQTGNTYTLNGIRINLRGDNLTEGALGTDAFTRLPGFLPPYGEAGGWPAAVRNYQRLNYNVVRMHLTPGTRYMMNVCDELGLLVIPETAIQGGGAKQENTERMPDVFTTHLRELILRDRNHPCVFKWSLENELSDAPEAFIRQLYDVCMATDGTRPCSVDDNADYPSWPRFTVIEHRSQQAGAPNAAGGRAHADRPYGQGEYVGPMGNSPAGPVWFGLETRALRAHDNADVRPYALLDVWPGVIPGQTPTTFPDPHLPPDSLEQGGHSLLNPAEPWDDPDIALIQRSFAPVAAYDLDYDAHVMDVGGAGEWPADLPVLPAGRTVTRQITVFNDEFAGSTLQVRVEPTLHPDAKHTVSLPVWTRSIALSPGGHRAVSLDLALPSLAHNGLLTLTLRVRKGSEERYTETDRFLVVPAGRAGTQALSESRDDTTHGDWVGAYGREAFLLPLIAGEGSFSLSDAHLQRGAGLSAAEAAETSLSGLAAPQVAIERMDPLLTVSDPRVLPGGDLKTRLALAFFATASRYLLSSTNASHSQFPPLIFRVDSQDDRPHRLSFYCLDYRRSGRAMSLDLYDVQGHLLTAQRIDHYSEGAYIRYRITGSVIAVFRTLTAEPPSVCGLFLDAAPGNGLLWQR